MRKLGYARHIAAVGVFSVASSVAMACDQPYSVLAGLVGNPASYASQLASYQQSFPECFGSTAVSTPVQTIAATSINQMTTISQGVGSRLLGSGGGGAPLRTAGLGGTGLAAGGAAGAWNAWANASGDTSSYKVNNLVVAGAAGTPFFIDNANKVSTIVAGADYRIAPSMVVGLSAAFDDSAGHVNPTSVVAGARSVAALSRTSGDGQSLAAYVGWQIDKNWVIDATAGYGMAKSSPAARTSVNSTRRFAGANLTYAHWVGNWQLNGKAGYQFAAEEYENSRRNGISLPLTYYTARLGQTRVGGEVGYWLASGVMPFVGVSYVNDVSRNRVRLAGSWDEDSLVATVGVNFFSLKNNLSAGIVYTDEKHRKFVDHTTWMANINYRF